VIELEMLSALFGILHVSSMSAEQMSHPCHIFLPYDYLLRPELLENIYIPLSYLAFLGSINGLSPSTLKCASSADIDDTLLPGLCWNNV